MKPNRVILVTAMIMNLIRWILSVVIAVAAVLFALGNRAEVSFVWSPFHDPATLPMFIPVLGTLMAGFVFGGFTVWLNSGNVRQERRKQRKQINKLEEQLREAETRAAQGPATVLTHE